MLNWKRFRLNGWINLELKMNLQQFQEMPILQRSGVAHCNGSSKMGDAMGPHSMAIQ
jgi:hypothetical protein